MKFLIESVANDSDHTSDIIGCEIINDVYFVKSCISGNPYSMGYFNMIDGGSIFCLGFTVLVVNDEGYPL